MVFCLLLVVVFDWSGFFVGGFCLFLVVLFLVVLFGVALFVFLPQL